MATFDWTYTDAIDATGDPVDFEVFDEIQTNVLALNTQVGADYGTDVFAGTGSSTTVTIPEQADTSYAVMLTAIGDEAALTDVGIFGYEVVSVTEFTVYNTGVGVTGFSYKVLR